MRGKRLIKRRKSVVLLAGLSLAWGGIRWGNAYTQPSGLSSSPQASLADCPATPNCVCSSASRPENKIDPIELREPVPDARAKLELIIQELPRSRIVVSHNHYLRAEFRSLVFGFVDDLELLFDEQQQVIGVRSASRIGYSDLGANRRRVEGIRRRYAALDKSR